MTMGTPGFRYHEGVAPFGELEILTPSSDNVDYQNIPPVMSVMPGRIAQKAWARSDWLRAEIGDRACEQLETETYPPLNQASGADAIHGFYLSDYCLAAAVRPGPNDTRDFASLGADWLVPSSMVGYGTGKLDVSGNVLERIYKRHFKTDHVYGKVSNINVKPQFQGMKVGAALLHGVLRQLPADKHSTLYVARANGGLIDKLGQLGYRETGSQTRSDLIEGFTLEEVRLQADSVGEVDEKLVSAYPWLDDAEIIS